MERLGVIITIIMVCQGVSGVTDKSALFEFFGVDNTPQRWIFTASEIRCAIACLVSPECQGFRYSSQLDDAAENCSMYNWLTPGGGDVDVFATKPNGTATLALTLGKHIPISFA